MDDYGFKKQNWNATETEVFLEILRKLDMRNCRDGRKVRNHKIFTLAHRRMLAAGYQRTVDQLKFRWKLLKSAYYKSKRNPHSPTLTKIQCWRRYERAMAAIMESEQSAVEAGVNCDGNDSDGEASTPQWTAQPWVESTPQIPDAVVKMEPQLRIGFVGAGNMAFGITKGILSGDILPGSIKVSAPSSRNLGKFEDLGVSVTHSNVEVVCESDLVFVAVKPHLIAEVLGEIARHVTDRHVIVSVAAGVTLATLEQLLPCNAVVMRLMPNLPCVIQEGALLFARGANAKQEDATLLRSLLHHCGLVEEGPEDWIDIHTGLSGSGVAFVYLFAEALAEGAVKMGMPSALANTIASQTVLGAGRLLRDSGKHPAQLRSEVCTPGGTTIFGLHTLEQGGVRAATMNAVESATKRARELGQKSAALK